MATLIELPQLQSVSYEEVCRAVLEAARTEDLDTLGVALSQLERAAVDDLDAVTDALADLDALTRDVGDLDGAAAGLVRHFLPGAIAVLEAAGGRMRMAEGKARRRRSAEAVSGRVLTELTAAGRPMRSGDLADALGIDIAQVSRALGVLRERGLVTGARAPVTEMDGRARWHVAVGLQAA